MKKIGATYTTNEMTEAAARYVKKDLVLKQRGGEDYGFAQGQRVVLYREGMFGIEVPRAYGRREFGPPDTDETVQVPIQPFTFTKGLRADQPPLIKGFLDRVRDGKSTDAYGGIFNAPCGTGKTVMAIKMLSEMGQAAIVLVHTGALMKQWQDELLKFTDLKPDQVGRIQQDECDWRGKSVVVAMIESLSRRDYEPDMYRAFGVAVFDECVVGGSKIQTEKGLIPIVDFPSRSPTYALSFNELLKKWEYRRILRWMPRGRRRTLTIRAGGQSIRCTPEHPFLTDKGEVVAGSLCPGMRVRSPVPAGAGFLSPPSIGGEDPCDLFGGIVSGDPVSTGRRDAMLLRQLHRFVRVDAENAFGFISDLRRTDCELQNGRNIFQDTIWPAKSAAPSPVRPSAFSTEHCSETAEYHGPTRRLTHESNLHMGNASGCGRGTRGEGFGDLELIPGSRKVLDLGREVVLVAESVIQDLTSCFGSSDTQNEFQWNGSASSPKRDGRGGTWMTGTLREEESPFTQRGSRNARLRSLPDSSEEWDSTQLLNRRGNTSFFDSGLKTRSAGSNDLRSSALLEWDTSFLTITEIVEDPRSGSERVFDLEVEGNHNFVADGFLVHNCHRHAAATWHKVISMFPARVRIGLSATPRRSDGLWKVIVQHLGSVLASGEVGGSAKVFRIMTGVGIPSNRYIWGGTTYLGALLKALTKVPTRNEMIVNEVVKALGAGRRVLVLSDRLAHLDEIERIYRGRISQEERMAAEMSGDASFLGIGRYVGGTSDADLESARKCRLLLGTFQYAKEGLDDPGLDTLMLTVPKGDVEQPIGRILRQVEGKKDPIVIDFVDDKTELCNTFAEKRLRQYSRLGYDVSEIVAKTC